MNRRGFLQSLGAIVAGALVLPKEERRWVPVKDAQRREECLSWATWARDYAQMMKKFSQRDWSRFAEAVPYTYRKRPLKDVSIFEVADRIVREKGYVFTVKV